MYWKEVLIILLIFGLASTITYWQTEVKQYQQTLEILKEQVQQKETFQTPQKINKPETEKPTILEKIVEKEIMPKIKSRTMPVLAYNRNTQKGVVGSVEVSLVQGKGDIVIDVRPFNSPAVQKSAENAVTAAIIEAGKKQIVGKDIKIKFKIDAEAVGGDSAGIAIALATLSLITDQKVKDTVAATGTIDSAGNIGKVGGILQKAEAASKNGKRILLIPRGEGEVTVLTPHYIIDANTGKRLSKEEPILRTINAIKEARSRWSIDLQQVATLAEAKKYAFEELKQN